ncbi:MAG: DUF4783 domain-containing protein [Chitinophagaceae bacterium]
MKKKIFIQLVFVYLLSLLTFSSYAQVSATSVGNALKSGNATNVSKYFAATVDITINNSTSTYSKVQAELVLKDFFNKNPVRNFDTELPGNSNAEVATFTIGKLTTANGDFKVYIWLKPNGKSYTLKALRFDK